MDTVVHYLRGLDLLPAEYRHASVRRWWSIERLLTDMVLDAKGAASIGWNLAQLRRLSWEVKERLSPDTWRVLQQIGDLFADVAPANHERRVVAAMAKLDDVVIMLSAFAGLLAENPTRGHGWRFLAIGRRMERALQMLELLRVGVAQAPFPDDQYLEVLLQVADSSTTYRSRYLASIRTRYVLELLMSDVSNPRSVAYQIAVGGRAHPGPARPTRRIAPLAARRRKWRWPCAVGRLLQDANMDDLKRRDVHGKRPALENHLQAVKVGDGRPGHRARRALPQSLGAVAPAAQLSLAQAMRTAPRTPREYAYEATVSQCLSEVRLTPRALPWQTLVESRIQTTPEPASVARHKDYFGNEVTSFTIVESHDRFTTVATSLVDVAERTAPAAADTAVGGGARRPGRARSSRGARGVRVHAGLAVRRHRSGAGRLRAGQLRAGARHRATPPRTCRTASTPTSATSRRRRESTRRSSTRSRPGAASARTSRT